MGIGGAVMNVPILKFFGYSINKAIGSAATIGFLIALFGAIGFLVFRKLFKNKFTFKYWFYQYSSIFNFYSNNNIYGKSWSKNSS